MAMTTCKECGSAISSKAKQCPACGINIRRTSGCAWIALVVFAVPVLIAVVIPFFKPPPPPTPEKQRAALPVDQCAEDLQCWGERNIARATPACTAAVINLAKWDHQWTDGIGKPRFSRWGRGTGHRTLIYTGEQLRLQNGFGAWQRVRYACEFDPASGTATANITER